MDGCRRKTDSICISKKQPSSAIKIMADNIFHYQKSSELTDILRKKCSEITNPQLDPHLLASRPHKSLMQQQL